VPRKHKTRQPTQPSFQEEAESTSDSGSVHLKPDHVPTPGGSPAPARSPGHLALRCAADKVGSKYWVSFWSRHLQSRGRTKPATATKPGRRGSQRPVHADPLEHSAALLYNNWPYLSTRARAAGRRTTRHPRTPPPRGARHPQMPAHLPTPRGERHPQMPTPPAQNPFRIGGCSTPHPYVEKGILRCRLHPPRPTWREASSDAGLWALKIVVKHRLSHL
jgi:hypothetical protein